jgi:hypothetical protein
MRLSIEPSGPVNAREGKSYIDPELLRQYADGGAVRPLAGAPMCTGPAKRAPSRSLAQPSPLKYATTSSLFLLRAMDSALLPREDVHTGSAPCFTSSFTIARFRSTPSAMSRATIAVLASTHRSGIGAASRAS